MSELATGEVKLGKVRLEVQTSGLRQGQELMQGQGLEQAHAPVPVLGQGQQQELERAKRLEKARGLKQAQVQAQALEPTPGLEQAPELYQVQGGIRVQERVQGQGQALGPG